MEVKMDIRNMTDEQIINALFSIAAEMDAGDATPQDEKDWELLNAEMDRRKEGICGR